MIRYETFNHVALSKMKAYELARIDHTPKERIEIREGVSPIHITESWTLWSDGKVTTSNGLPEIVKAKRLTPDAERLISKAHGADAGIVDLSEGMLSLAAVDTILREEMLKEGSPRGNYPPPNIKRMRVRLRDGSEDTWYVYNEEYSKGYLFGVSGSLDRLSGWLEKNDLHF